MKTVRSTEGVAGAILAGGASRRMGADKALAPIEGRPMVLHVADALGEAGVIAFVVASGDPARFDALGLAVVADRWPGEGPLGGILTALGATSGGVVVVGCDMPAVDPATIGALIAPAEDVDAVVAVAAGVRQPLLARYRRSAQPGLVAEWEQGERAPSRALAVLRVREVVVPATVAQSIDTPAELHAARRRSG